MNSSSCSQRLNRDVAELFSSKFHCSASHLTVVQSADSLNEPGSITLDNMVFEGPYRGGRFCFCFHIPANYPFRSVEVWATQPIWHPNVDLRTGKVAIPMEWSPVLTLTSFALAVQMLMLEPSSENPLNLDAFSLYMNQSAQFDFQAQSSLKGGWFSEIHFSDVRFSQAEMNDVVFTATGKRHSDRQNTLGVPYSTTECFTSSKRGRAVASEGEDSESSARSPTAHCQDDSVWILDHDDHNVKRSRIATPPLDAWNRLTIGFTAHDDLQHLFQLPSNYPATTTDETTMTFSL